MLIRPIPRVFIAPAVLAMVVLAAPHPAQAAGGTVQGVVLVPARVTAPPPEHVGFLPPLENPIADLRPHDPLPDLVVVLEKGPAGPDASTPPRSAVLWQVQRHAFVPAILAVVGGTPVELANVGRESHVLVASHQGLIPPDPVPPGSSRAVVAPALGGGALVHVRAEGTPHLRGRLLVLPTRYFARPDRNGRFRIEDVPAGRWTARVWYRDGWLAKTWTVDAPTRDLRVDLPDPLPAPGVAAPSAQ